MKPYSLSCVLVSLMMLSGCTAVEPDVFDGEDIIQRQRPTPAHYPAKQTVGAQGLEQHAPAVLRRVRGDGRVQPPRDLHAERRVEEVGSRGGPLPELDRRRLQHP